MFRFMTTFTSCFVMVKANGWGTLPKCRVDLAITSSQAPYFENATNPWALPYTEIYFCQKITKASK